MRVVACDPLALSRESFILFIAPKELEPDTVISVVKYRKQHNIGTATKPVSVAASSSNRLTPRIFAGLALAYCLGGIISQCCRYYDPTSDFNGSNQLECTFLCCQAT